MVTLKKHQESARRVTRRGKMWIGKLLPRLLASKEAEVGSYIGVNIETGGYVVSGDSLEVAKALEKISGKDELGWVHEVTQDDVKNIRMG
jgi:hypothetical protein